MQRWLDRWRARGRGGAFAGDGASEEGFSLIETIMSLGVIFVVLLGLLASLNTGISGLLTGRQRVGAVAVATEIIEEARAQPYADVGHDVDGDPTLAGDPAIGGVAPDYTYFPEGVSEAEALVASVNPHFPVHEWNFERDGSTFGVKVYVTWVDNLVGDDHKRLTVEVTYTPDQYQSEVVENVVRLSTFLSVGGQSFTGLPASPQASTSGVVNVDGGAATVTGTLDGVDLSRADLFFPFVHGDVDGEILKEGHGFAGSARSHLELNSGTPTGCEVTGARAECPGQRADVVVDNDGGTPAPIHDIDGPYSATGGTVAGDGAIDIVTGSTTQIESRASAESCGTCSPVVGDGDGLLYTWNHADAPDSAVMGFTAGILEGSLVSMSGTGSNRAVIDADPVTGGAKVSSTGELDVPGADLVTLNLGPAGFDDTVKIDAVDVTAQAEAGSTAAAPTVTGGTVNITVYDTDALGALGYRTISVTPGSALQDSATATFGVTDESLGISADVTLETTIEAGSAHTSCSPDCTTIEQAEASLTNWLTVTVRFTAVEAGVTTADLTIEIDYGRVTASAGYVPS